MEIKQSWIVTCAKGKLSLYELRIIIKIVEFCQSQLKDVYITRHLERFKEHCEDVTMKIPMRYILTDGSNHYEDVYEGARGLCSRTMEFLDTRTGTWRCSSIIHNVIHWKSKGIIEFTVYGAFLDALFDFTHGFSRYDLEQAMCMRLSSSVRLFMLMYGQTAPQDYSIGWLKESMGVSDKYKQTADFIKKCIKPACEEISEKTSIKVSWSPIKSGNKIVKIRLQTHRKPRPQENISIIAEEVKRMVSKDCLTYLMQEGGFTYRELSAHKSLMERLSEHPCAVDLVRGITHRARTSNKTKGWIIAGLRAELHQ